jgi:L-ascorbate metabolism protein UlaG (beta-lactamase superfamily)
MVKITWINHSCFLVEGNGKNIYFDPYKISIEYGTTNPADIIFASHDHYDHFDGASIKIITANNPNATIICPATCMSKGKKTNATGVKVGDKGESDGIKYEVTPAYNPHKHFHPKKNGWCAYIVEVDGKKIFHAGDSDYIPEYTDLKGKVDVALLPVGGTYTMDFKEAIEAVSAMKPKIVIPCHNWDKDLKKFKLMCEKANPDVKVAILNNTLEI